MTAQRLEIDAQQAGRRADVVLAVWLEASRVQVRRALERGQVRCNGRTLAAGDKGRMLAVGDVLEVEGEVDPSQVLPVAQPEIPLDIVASGADWLIVNKPQGAPVHPLAPGETGTLLNAVIARRPEIAGVGEGGLRSGVVHRIDVGTSGCVAFALSEERFAMLRKAFATHAVRKLYRAVVWGPLQGERREELDLVVAQHQPALVRVAATPDSRGARRCALHWRSLAVGADRTLIEVSLETGFLHQIRVTMAHLGHPVVGDLRYGRADDPAPRLMLHAMSLRVGNVAGDAGPGAGLGAGLDGALSP